MQPSSYVSKVIRVDFPYYQGEIQTLELRRLSPRPEQRGVSYNLSHDDNPPQLPPPYPASYSIAHISLPALSSRGAHTTPQAQPQTSPGNRVPAPSSIRSICPLASAPRQELLLRLHLSSSQFWKISNVWPPWFLAQKQVLVESLIWESLFGRRVALNAQW